MHKNENLVHKHRNKNLIVVGRILCRIRACWAFMTAALTGSILLVSICSTRISSAIFWDSYKVTLASDSRSITSIFALRSNSICCCIISWNIAGFEPELAVEFDERWLLKIRCIPSGRGNASVPKCSSSSSVTQRRFRLANVDSRFFHLCLSFK